MNEEEEEEGKEERVRQGETEKEKKILLARYQDVCNEHMIVCL
jgi:hypothetical protein